jgi:CMP-2-keto-3-deoxyoctulosonic acid synthetase
MALLRVALVVALFADLSSTSLAATTVDAILASPSTYDGQHVTVAGTVRDVEEKTSHKGNDYDVFQLCGDRCLHVFTFGRPPIAEGQKITVNGTFSAVKHVGSYTFRNEIEADEGSLP